jgi:hypothetical protein
MVYTLKASEEEQKVSDETADNICWIFIGLFTIYFSIKILPFLIDEIAFAIVGY